MSSESIKRTGTFEERIGQLIISSMAGKNDKGFIDIGASIGVHTLPIAKMGNRVIAVEPSPKNIQRLNTALQVNRISKSTVTIVQNALSDERGNITAHRNHKNPGLQSTVKKQDSNSHVVDMYRSIYMDDLLEVINFTEATLKIDIEASEPRAFAHASQLFQAVHITHVFMEWQNSAQYYWILQKEGKQGSQLMDQMLDFFYRQGYQAYNLYHGLLNREVAEQWPIDIYWFKNIKFSV